MTGMPKVTKELKRVLESASIQRNDEQKREKARRYYNGDQDTDAIRDYRELHQMQGLTTNLIRDAINSVLGAEEQRRVDWVLRADDEDSTEIAEGLNVKLNETMRMIDANEFCSEAYKHQAIGGLGVLKFGKSTNPLEYKYKLQHFESKDFLFDQTSLRKDGKDCHWQALRHYKTEGDAIALFPEHEKLIKESFAAINTGEWDILEGSHPGFSAVTDEARSGISISHYRQELYLDGIETVMAIYEVYYRSFEDVHLIHWPDGNVQEYNKSDIKHVIAHLSAQAHVKEERIPIMRCSWHIGPTCVKDERSPHPHNEFPTVMFRGYMNEDERRLYGLVEDMISPQDSYNEANVRIHHLLNSKLIIADDDAFDPRKYNDEEVVIEANSATGYLKKRPGKSVEIITYHQEISRLIEIKSSSREEVRIASGISYSFTGQDVEQKSGVAIQSLAEMSAATLAEFNSAYQMSRTLLGRLVLAHIIDEIGDQETVVPIKSEGGQMKKTVVINAMEEDGMISNALPMARMQVVLADAKSSEGYRAQTQQQMMSMYQVSSPEVQEELIPIIIENSDMPNRHEILERINKRRGRGNSEEEQQQIDDAQQKAQQAETELVRRERMAKVMLDEANAAKIAAEAESIKAGAVQEQGDKLDAEIDAIIQEEDQKVAELDNARRAVAERASSRLAA